jgi:hypothetical protein
MSYTLNNGDKFESQNTSIEILDQDRLCYLVKNNSANGATGIRTISKKLVNEFVEYLKDHPNAKAEEARDELKTGPSGIDNYEYGYAATLLKLAQRALDNNANGEVAVTKSNNKPLQQIFYGAPGTGKSYKIKEMIKTVDHIRTTFHPDSDYSTFVGAYKPTTIRVPVRTMIGKDAVIVKDENKNDLYEDKIVYKFVPQAFLQAYVRAWKKYSGVSKIEEVEDEILVIEEINRGNCAQIFGDLFQLLDRKDAGFSEYPITADADMKKYLEEEFEKINLDKVKGVINGYYKGEDNDKDIDICRQVLDGDILLLPNNLYIWATMNTSDQSLFPIDSAFKRRWDWQYVPISNAGKDWVISVNGNKYDWWEFLTKINEKIYDTTHSEDKKLGYFFCKAEDGVIDAEMFVGKVIFYLWNDVFKDMEFEDGIFKDGEDGKLSFDKFYKVEKGETKVDSGKVEVFLENLRLEPSNNDKDDSNNSQNYEQDDKSPIKVTYNGKSYDGKNAMDMLKKLIKDIGVERVRGIQENGKIAGYYMIVDDDIIKESNNKFFKSKDKVESMKNNHEIGKGLYLFPNTSSLYKVTQLKEIKKKLNLDLEAEII